MRREFKKKIERKQAEKNTPIDVPVFKSGNGRAKSVTLHFLDERPSVEYLQMSSDKPNDSNPLALAVYEQPRREVMAEHNSPPPLSMNALTEYKGTLRAPGVGEFSNGKPALFKI